MDAIPGAGGASVLAGRYEVGPLVGLGGTARVYRARDQVDGITVAVKIFPAGSADGPGGDGSRELAVLGRMRHPGLVGVRDSGVDGEGHPFVVMDFVEGRSLAVRLRDGVLPAATTTAMGAMLADALAHVHANGVVHRDVKPGNVLLDADGRARLTDFGIARLVDSTRVTATGLVVGTAAYMAPEQVRGEVVGPPADVYALGLVLLEAVTGRREFEGGALEAAIARLHRSPVVPASVPEPLASAVRRMTAADPADRPSASEVAAALGSAPARRRPLGRPLARRLVSAGAFASLAASAVVGVVLTGGDTSAGVVGEPAVQAAMAPEPVVAPPVTTTTAAVVPDEPVAVTPTTPARSTPVHVAHARRERTTVTRTIIRVTTVTEKPAKRTTTKDRPADQAKGGEGEQDDKKDGETSAKPTDDKDDDKDTPGDDDFADHSGAGDDRGDNSGPRGSDNGGSGGPDGSGGHDGSSDYGGGSENSGPGNSDGD